MMGHQPDGPSCEICDTACFRRTISKPRMRTSGLRLHVAAAVRPTRRHVGLALVGVHVLPAAPRRALGCRLRRNLEDRKSTRLNSSHVKNSYAVFCLKKKN